MRPVGYDGAPEGVEEGEEEGGGELEEEGGEGGGEALLGEGAVCVVDTRGRISLWFSILFVLPPPLASLFCYHSASLYCLLFLDTWFITDREGDRGLTEEQPFPYFKKIGGCEWAAGRKVDAERLEGFFAGWAVYRSEVLAGIL